MLDQHLISVWKLKQAYELSGQEAESLLEALLPDRVYPYDLWQKAHAEFWGWAVRTAVARYSVASPQFPEAGALPEKHFPKQLHVTLIVRFFAELSKTIEVAELEKGLDYILGTAYGETVFPFEVQKKALLQALREEENSRRNRERTSGPLHIESMQAVDYFCIAESFPDTIVVDKTAAVLYLHSCGFPLRHEVKGLAQAWVREITMKPETEARETGGIAVPAALWEGKTPPAVRDALRENNFTDPVIARVLYEWCGLTNQTQIGMLLGPVGAIADSTSLRRGKRLLAEAETLSIRKA